MSPNIQESRLRLRDQILPELLEEGRVLAQDFLKNQKNSLKDNTSNEATTKPEADAKPDNIDQAIGWGAKTQADGRVLAKEAREAAAREEARKDKDKEHTGPHNQNMPIIAEQLKLAKEERDNKNTILANLTSVANEPTVADEAAILTEISDVPNNINVAKTEVVTDVATQEAPSSAMPDIDLSSTGDNQKVPPVAGGQTTGANRGFELLMNEKESANTVADTSVPAESIQAGDNLGLPATIETARSDGKSVEVEGITTTELKPEASPVIPPVAEVISPVIEVTPPVNEVIEPVENSITVSEAVAPIPPVIPPAEATTPPSAPPVNVETVPAGQAETPPQSVPEMPKGRGILSFFNKLVPKGEARADYFKFAAKVAEGRDKQPALPPPEEELKQAA